MIIEVANNYAIKVRDDYVRFAGIQARVDGANAHGQAAIELTTLSAGDNFISVQDCILRAGATNNRNCPAFKVADGDAVAYVYNNLMYDGSTRAAAFNAIVEAGSGSDIRLSANTIHYAYNGVVTAGASTYLTAKNNVAAGGSNASFVGGYNGNSTNNC